MCKPFLSKFQGLETLVFLRTNIFSIVKRLNYDKILIYVEMYIDFP